MQPQEIRLKQVLSTQINAVGYDKETNVLVIEFNNGARYAYMNVPEQVYNELMNAPSIGAYWNNVKRNYQYQKL